ncbi:ABC transporter ATP-binding protein [Bifidobacterium lemurum]|uniref:ABC transporter ATP-binding protein n=1 Tax=Bifidobacterium lemurum TaxID=1603886 RepID=A0A261FTD7_9BIFI|nr:ABC transporter ATP-binding protein [Bifidobacterium lemurum]OZG62417.1 ABC transporter ATP-binding protein [Bifidobacterium lemurum]QOL33767.1 ABC transporter ATP-binding protein [Bifidobacterium lemurum]
MTSPHTTSLPLARLRDVERSFDGTAVLRDVSLDIRPGEFVALIGRSGCGKSTLLRLVARLLEPSGGSIDATDDFAVGFQDARLIPWLRLWDNVTIGLPGTAHERHDLAERALADVQLAARVDAWPGELSGGQAQRASLARALARHPRLLLLDEPFGALDALTRLDMQDLLAALHDREGWAALMVTHDIAEAVRLSDRILVLREGRITDDVPVDRTDLDDQGRPRRHAEIEEMLRSALR